ncbi:GGDEF domain-containing protein [Roseateles koreensis]|uniref:diguanylate cyclase n=1 Tax=Roseateles koreensis TaxID=2987526 RepID=A0ABT5KZ43_9BURK|nr:diguanylate cyclase [Roseateles koreensis]MDC8787086.1 diguanylate cyclase [Roseateles koreensis]
MRYTDSLARSAEHLRAALPLMTRQRAALHPVSYAVWYEFVSARNLALHQAVLTHTRDGATLDEAQTWALYQDHIGSQLTSLDAATAQKVGDGLARVLDTMAASAAEAGQETARFDNSLNTWVEQLLGDPNQQTQADVLQELLSGSREIRGAVGALQSQLSQSQHEIEALRQEVRHARNEALVDALTGLSNRRAFDQALSTCLANSAHKPDDPKAAASTAPCLVLGDIDFFKRINDSFGHGFGDQVLRAVAQTLKTVAANDIITARIGGEEFALLLPRSSLDQAEGLAEKMRSTVAKGRIRRGEQAQEQQNVTISFGVTQLAPGESANDFLNRADRALYASKHQGRNRVTVLTSDSNDAQEPVKLRA